MTKSFAPSTPQFRTAIVRKLKNLAPEYTVEFVDAKRGVAFRIRDRQGRYRSGVVTIVHNKGHALDGTRLEQKLKTAGFPGVMSD